MSIFNDGDRNDIIRELRRQEYFDQKAEQECCGTCRFHKQDEQFSEDWMCCNDESDNFGDYTGYEDGCSEYEKR